MSTRAWYVCVDSIDAVAWKSGTDKICPQKAKDTNKKPYNNKKGSLATLLTYLYEPPTVMASTIRVHKAVTLAMQEHKENHPQPHLEKDCQTCAAYTQDELIHYNPSLQMEFMKLLYNELHMVAGLAQSAKRVRVPNAQNNVSVCNAHEYISTLEYNMALSLVESWNTSSEGAQRALASLENDLARLYTELWVRLVAYVHSSCVNIQHFIDEMMVVTTWEPCSREAHKTSGYTADLLTVTLAWPHRMII